MTLNDIIVSSLAQLDRGHDAQSLDAWRDKLTSFANDAVQDLARAYKPNKTEDVTPVDGNIDTRLLSCECSRVSEVNQNGKRLAFESGSESAVIHIPGYTSGPVTVSYCYAPDRLSSPTDVPGLPERYHGLIVCYVVARERAAGDVGVQRGGNIYFQMYNAGKAAIRAHMGESSRFQIVNRW